MFKTKWRHRSNSFSTKKQFTGRTCCFLPILLRLSNVGHSFGNKTIPEIIWGTGQRNVPHMQSYFIPKKKRFRH